MTSLVSAQGVSKRYGDIRAVDNVSFEIEKGKIMGLIGPNGAGKTTLLKALLGLTDCDGQLSVLGLDPFRQRKELMQNICFIADVAVLPRWIRVSQLLDFHRADASEFFAGPCGRVACAHENSPRLQKFANCRRAW